MSGRILDVVERHTHRFVGTYRESGNYGVVVVDGGGFDSAILVGDAGAKNCRIEDKVVVEMVHFPTDQRTRRGRDCGSSSVREVNRAWTRR